MKKILILNGHPNPESYCSALALAYKKGAERTTKEIKTIELSEINFNPILKHGYQKRTELELDLFSAWQKIEWADHIVIITPIWWGGIPAGLKGFFDRVFLPGMAFQYRENSVFWDKLLTGKTAHIISTMDTPNWYYKLIYGNAGIKQLKNNILEFCGIKVVKTTAITPMRNSTEAFRKKWLDQIENDGYKLK